MADKHDEWEESKDGVQGQRDGALPLKTEFDDALEGIYGEHDAEDVDAAAGYQVIGTLSVGCFVLGLLSVLTFLHFALVVVPLASLTLGVLAMRKILHAREVTTGATFTTAGIILAVTFWTAGYGWLIYDFYTRAPAGYVVVDWTDLVADGARPSKKAFELENQRVFVRGYMRPTRHVSNLRRFSMRRSQAHCKSCSPLTRPTDVMQVELIDGLTVDLTSRKLGVGGFLHLNRGGTDEIEKNIPSDAAFWMEADVIR